MRITGANIRVRRLAKVFSEEIDSERTRRALTSQATIELWQRRLKSYEQGKRQGNKEKR